MNDLTLRTEPLEGEFIRRRALYYVFSGDERINKTEDSMSYCRVGHDSDVWVYCTNEESYTVHVAKERRINSTSIAIGLSQDDKWLHFKSAPALLDGLNNLVKEGYRVPERTFKRLQREITGVA